MFPKNLPKVGQVMPVLFLLTTSQTKGITSTQRGVIFNRGLFDALGGDSCPPLFEVVTLSQLPQGLAARIKSA